jgi:hypothetical protein
MQDLHASGNHDWSNLKSHESQEEEEAHARFKPRDTGRQRETDELLEALAESRREIERKVQTPPRDSDQHEHQPYEHLFSKKKTKMQLDMQDNTNQISSRGVATMRLEKECPIRLKSFKLAEVALGMKKILDWQEEHDQPAKMNKVLDRNLKYHLEIKYGISGSTLAHLAIEELFSIVSRETQVFSKQQFYKELEDALGHIHIMPWDSVNCMNHETFYYQQIKLVHEFNRLLQIMLMSNAQHCPEANMKHNGLIKLFMLTNDHQYAQYCVTSIPPNSYKTFNSFATLFLDQALLHYELSLRQREMPYAQNRAGEAKQKEYYRKRKEFGKNLSRDKTESSDIKHALSHMYKEESNEGSDSEIWKDKVPDGDSSDDSVSLGSLVDQSESPLENFDHLQQELLAFGEHQENTPPDKKTFACLKRVLSGKCDNANCQYGHKPDVLEKGAKILKEKLSAFLLTGSAKLPEKSDVPYAPRQEKKFG